MSRNCVQEEDAFTKVRSQPELLGITNMLTKMKHSADMLEAKIGVTFRTWKQDKRQRDGKQERKVRQDISPGGPRAKKQVFQVERMNKEGEGIKEITQEDFS